MNIHVLDEPLLRSLVTTNLTKLSNTFPLFSMVD
uniref:Transposase n=1 Tax=Brugia timori TaxID=42155 RepID=A0A0R3RAS2_9BILA